MSGANPNGPENNPWAMLTGPLTGRVVDQTGKPIGGARVFWVNLSREAPGGQPMPIRVAGQETTRPDGTFSFKQPARLAGTQASRLVVETGSGMAAVVSKVSNSRGDLVVTVFPGRKLTVRLQTPAGKPAAGVALKALISFPASRQPWFYPYQGGKALRTDATGSVTLNMLPPAVRIRVEVQDPRYRLDPPWNEYVVRRNADSIAPPAKLTALGGRG